jgi:hypothetical protein
MSLGAGEAHILNVCVRDEFRNVGFGAPARAPAGAAAAAGVARPSSRCGRATCGHPALSTSRIRTNRHPSRVLSGPRRARRRHRAEARAREKPSYLSYPEN